MADLKEFVFCIYWFVIKFSNIECLNLQDYSFHESEAERSASNDMLRCASRRVVLPGLHDNNADLQQLTVTKQKEEL